MKTMATRVTCGVLTALAIWGWGPPRQADSEERSAAKPPAPTSAEDAAEKPREQPVESWFGGLGRPRLPPLDRNLYLDELDRVLCASDVLIDKRCQMSGERQLAASLLYKYHHPYCLPAPLAVALDEDDDAGLRAQCVVVLATHPAPMVAGYLIELVDDPEIRVARAAVEALYHVTGRDFTHKDLQLPPEAASPERKQIQEQWRRWWKEHRQEFKAAGQKAEEK